MQQLSLFSIEVAISLSVSFVVALSITKSLHSLLVDVCGTVERAKFWVVYSNVMTFIAPLLVVMLFGKSSSVGEQTFVFYKTAFGCSLAGVFVSLLAIGLQISNSISDAEKRKLRT